MRQLTGVSLTRRNIRDNIEYYLMMLPVLVLIVLFSYYPLYGIVIAFQNYMPGRPFFGAEAQWVGLKWFREFIGSFYFVRILKNTLVLSMLNLLMGFWVPIVFALLLNELRSARLKKAIQTVCYMPHFISMVVVASMALSFVASDGFIVQLSALFGGKKQSLVGSAAAFPWIYTVTNIWKSFGWSSILYLSTMASIDPELYEAASIDGAKRLHRIWYVTLPELAPLIVIQLIFAIGGLLGSNTELILLLYTPSTYAAADVIGTYVYREGLSGGRFSYGTAAGVFMSVIGFAMTCATNYISGKTTEYSLW